MATIIQLRRDETVNWVEANPILAEGEPGIEIISGNSLALKIGDGIHSGIIYSIFFLVLSVLENLITLEV